MSVPPKPKPGISTLCEHSGSQSLNQTVLDCYDDTLFADDVNNGSFSALPSGVNCGNASDAEIGEPVTADTSSIVSSADRTASGSKWDDDVAAQPEEDDELRGRWRSPWSMSGPETRMVWRPGFPVSGVSAQYVTVGPDSAVQVDGGSDLPSPSRTNCSIYRNQKEDDDFPLLPKSHKPCVIRGAEPLKTSQYASESVKPSMTWAERLRATIASPTEKTSLKIPVRPQDSWSIPRHSVNLTAELGQHTRASDRAKLQQVSIASPRNSGPVSPKRASLSIEWRTAAPTSSPRTTPKSESSLHSPQPSPRSSVYLTHAYGSTNEYPRQADGTHIHINEGPQTVTAKSVIARGAPNDGTQPFESSDPINAADRLVEATQHERHLLSVASGSSFKRSQLSASSPCFVPSSAVVAHPEPLKNPSYAEVARSHLPGVRSTSTTPSSASTAFFSAPQTPEHSIEGAYGVLGGGLMEPELEGVAPAEQAAATPLKILAGIEEEAAGSPRLVMQTQHAWEHQLPLSMSKPNHRGKRQKKKKNRMQKTKGISPTTPGGAEALQWQPQSLTPSNCQFWGSTGARSGPNSTPRTPLFMTSEVDGCGIPMSIGSEVPRHFGLFQRASQMRTDVPKVTPCSKITIVIAAEHVGWYCPACDLKQ